VLIIDFDTNKVENPEYSFYLNIPNREAAIAVREFNEIRTKYLENSVKFTPVYNIF